MVSVAVKAAGYTGDLCNTLNGAMRTCSKTRMDTMGVERGCRTKEVWEEEAGRCGNGGGGEERAGTRGRGRKRATPRGGRGGRGGGRGTHMLLALEHLTIDHASLSR